MLRALALCAVAGAVLAAAGAASPGRIALRDGQTRWFFDGGIRTGERVVCAARGSTVAATVPAAPRSGFAGEDMLGRDGLGLSIERRPDGAAQVRCGAAADAAPRPATLPYVVGPNGLGLIRGPNRLAALERLYGPPALHAGSGGCTAAWRRLGLRVTFATAACEPDGVLRRAVVTGRCWQTLSGTRVGDAVGAMRWRQRDARALTRRNGTTTWLLAAARRAPHPRLLAAATGGRVASLTVAPG